MLTAFSTRTFHRAHTRCLKPFATLPGSAHGCRIALTGMQVTHRHWAAKLPLACKTGVAPYAHCSADSAEISARGSWPYSRYSSSFATVTRWFARCAASKGDSLTFNWIVSYLPQESSPG